MQRLSLIKSHLIKNKTSVTTPKSDDDVVICCAVRTPFTKANKGGLKDTPIELLVAHVLKAIQEKTKINPIEVNDIVMGNLLQPGSANKWGRIGQFLAGYPYEVPFMTLNRFGAAGIETCALIAAKIKAGMIDVGIGGGYEKMSHLTLEDIFSSFTAEEEIEKNPSANASQIPMGVTAEIIAERFGLTREDCDRFAFESQRRAMEAQKLGLTKDEIVPMTATIVNKNKDGTITKKEVFVSEDDGVRPTTMESLKSLKSSFKKDGVTTAGNSSQITDGAAAVLLARRSTAKRLGLPILAKWRSYVATGVPPEIMGIGPSVAIPMALKKAGISKNDVDIFEITEAFAATMVYNIRKLELDEKKVNPRGGGISVGHPLAASGARSLVSLLSELKRTKGKIGVVSMCIGTGMGAAAVIELEN